MTRTAARAALVLAGLCALSGGAPARAEVARFAVIVGNNVGAAGEVELRYAEADAAKVVHVLGTRAAEAPELAEFVPAFWQYEVAVPPGTLGLRLTLTLEGSSETAPEARVAWRAGEPVSYAYQDGVAQVAADALSPLSGEDGSLAVVVSGSCLAGGPSHYFHIHNLGADTISIVGAQLELLAEDPGAAN